MVNESLNYRCFGCGSRFPINADVAGGRFLAKWKVAVCNHCLARYPDGLPANHPAFWQLELAHIEISPTNKKAVPWPG